MLTKPAKPVTIERKQNHHHIVMTRKKRLEQRSTLNSDIPFHLNPNPTQSQPLVQSSMLRHYNHSIEVSLEQEIDKIGAYFSPYYFLSGSKSPPPSFPSSTLARYQEHR